MARAITVAAVLFAPGVAASAQRQSSARAFAQNEGAQAQASCTARVVEEDSIALGTGQAVYVEPSTFSSDGGHALLLGIPTYLSAGSSVVRDSIVGVVRRPAGPWEPVPSPLPGRHPFSFRASPRGDGVWDVLFIELDKPFRAATSDSSVGVWHAVLRSSRWESLQRIQLPDSLQPKILSNSPLLRTGDTLTWAALAAWRYAAGLNDAIVLEQRGRQWSWRRLGYAGTWISIGNDGRGRRRLLLAVGDRIGRNQPFGIRLFALDSAISELALATSDQVASVSAVPSGVDGFLATYHASTSGRWLASDLGPSSKIAPPVEFGMSVRRVSAAFGARQNAPAIWVASEAGPSSESEMLAVLAGDSTGTRTVARLRNRFAAPSPVFVESDKRLHIVGPMFAERASGKTLQSLLLTVDIACRDRR